MKSMSILILSYFLQDLQEKVLSLFMKLSDKQSQDWTLTFNPTKVDMSAFLTDLNRCLAENDHTEMDMTEAAELLYVCYAYYREKVSQY